MADEESTRNKENSRQPRNGPYPDFSRRQEDMKIWSVLLFGVIGATVTTFAIGQLRRTVDWFYVQVMRSQQSSRGGSSSFRTTFQEEAWKRYNRRMQEEYEEEMERVERIRRMQSVFNRERNKYKKNYETWREYGPGAYHQHFQRDDWYWKSDPSFRDQQSNYKRSQRDPASYPLSHHYSVLGLDRSRNAPYTETEIKNAFRAKAKQYHPDQNQDNKEVAEAKFKEVMLSYEAIKGERKDARR